MIKTDKNIESHEFSADYILISRPNNLKDKQTS